MTPRCIMQREDFYHNHGLDYPLHHTAERFDSLLQNAAERFDSSLHNAAGSQTLILITPRIRQQIRKFESGSKVGTFDEKNGGGKSHATVPLKVQ